jgi:hypothetical protein
MPGPQINLTMGSDALSKIGQYKEAAKVARREVQQLQKEAKQTARLLGGTHALTQQRMAELSKAQARIDGFKEQAKKQLAPAHLAHEVHMYGKLAKAQAVKELLSGQGGVQDILMLAHSRTLRKVAAKVGLENVAGFLGKAAGPIALGLMAFEAVKSGVEKYHKEREATEDIGREYGLGKASEGAFKFYQDRNTWLHPLTDMAEETRTMQEATKALSQESEEKRKKELKAALLKVQTDAKMPGKEWGYTPMGWAEYIGAEAGQVIVDRFRSPIDAGKAPKWMRDQEAPIAEKKAAEVEKKIEEGLAEKQKTKHADLTPEERHEEIEKVLQAYVADLPKAEGEKVSEALKEAIKKLEDAKAPMETAVRAYEEHKKKRNHDFIAHARDKRFSAAESFGQVLWVGE